MMTASSTLGYTPNDYLDWVFQYPKEHLQDLNFLASDSREDVERSLDDYDSVDYDRLVENIKDQQPAVS